MQHSVHHFLMTCCCVMFSQFVYPYLRVRGSTDRDRDILPSMKIHSSGVFMQSSASHQPSVSFSHAGLWWPGPHFQGAQFRLLTQAQSSGHWCHLKISWVGSLEFLSNLGSRRLSPNPSQHAQDVALLLGLIILLNKRYRVLPSVPHSFSVFMSIVGVLVMLPTTPRGVITTRLETMQHRFGEVNKIVQGHRVGKWKVLSSRKYWDDFVGLVFLHLPWAEVPIAFVLNNLF